MSNKNFSSNRHNYLETKPSNLKILLIVILCSGIFGIYSYFRDKPNVVRINEPPIDPFWALVAENDRVEIYTDIFNIEKNNQDNYIVDYWEKVVLLVDFKIDEKLNSSLLIKFDDSIESIISHYSVNCVNHTYQRLNSVYTQVDGKTRFMNTDNDPLPAVPISEDMLIYSSSMYACQIKDMDVTQRLATVE